MPVYANPTKRLPSWLQPGQESVLDSTGQRLVRWLAGAIGANDPQSQVMGMMAPLMPETKALAAGLQPKGLLTAGAKREALINRLTETPQVQSQALESSPPLITRLADEGGTIQLGFDQPTSPEIIKQMFPGQQLSIEPVKPSPFDVRKHPWYRVGFLTPTGQQDWDAATKAVKDLGGRVWMGWRGRVKK